MAQPSLTSKAMPPSANGGLFVTIDGQSGAGKTTAVRLLHARLRECHCRVLSTSTPSPSPVGALARQGTFEFQGRELTYLVAADRYHHYRTVIQPALGEGALLLCDRYLASSLVLDPLDGVAPALVWALYDDLPKADLAIILYGDPAVCARRAAVRGHSSRFHTDDVAVNGRERVAFLEAAVALTAAGHPVVTHDITTATADQVAEDLKGVILAAKGRPT